MFAHEVRIRCAKAEASRPARLRAQFKQRSLLAILVGTAFAPHMNVQALELGDIEPRSSLGEPFAARIPLEIGPGEDLSTACVSVLPHPDAASGMALPPRLRVSIESSSGRRWIALRNATLTYDPVVGLRIEFNCNNGELPRDYVVFLDPAPEVPAPIARREQVARREQATPVAEANRGNTASTSARPHNASQKARRPARSAKRAGDDRKLTAQSAAGERAQVALAGGPVPHLEYVPLEISRRIQSLEGSLAALREQLEQRQQAAAVAPEQQQQAAAATPEQRQQAAAATPEQRQQAAAATAVPAETSPVLRWVLAGVPAFLALTGLLAWWRRRRRDDPPAMADSREQYESAVKERPRAVADAQQTVAAPIASYGAVATSRQAPQSMPAPGLAPWPKPAPRLDSTVGLDLALDSTVPVELAPLEPEPQPMPAPPLLTEAVAAHSKNIDPRQPQGLPDLVFTSVAESPSRAVQEVYFAGRFGGSLEDTRILDDLDIVIEQARSIFEDDNDSVRASDLLELALMLHPGEVRPWLALFAIYRRSSMARQFAILAEKFCKSFPIDPNWPTIQRLGREFDVDNPLYALADGIEDSAGDDASRQEVTDKWLDVPLDFTGMLLADELRDQLLNDDAAGTPLAARGR